MSDKYTALHNRYAELEKKAQKLAQEIIVGEKSTKDAYQLLGTADAIKVKMRHDVALTDYDRDYIFNML